MKAKFLHNNFNVLDLDKSLAFYKEALGLTEKRRLENAGLHPCLPDRWTNEP